ncbi:MAG: hypothetical protein WCO63_15860, partial [Bacteroidota bacterium]
LLDDLYNCFEIISKCRRLKDLPFFPKENFIQKFYTHNQDILIDKKGRVYNQWSSGRRRNESINIETNAATENTKQKV